MNTFLSILSASKSSTQFMKPALIVLTLIAAALVISTIVFTVLSARNKNRSAGSKVLLVVVYLATAAVLTCTILCFGRYINTSNAPTGTTAAPTVTTAPTTEPTTEATTEATTEPPTEPEPTYEAAYTEDSDPKNWKVKWEIIQDGKVVDSYTRPETITFGDASEYAALDGVFTFRGDNYRSGAAFGTVDIVNQTLSKKWEAKIGSLSGANGTWTGCGWTGQPSIVRWDNETKQIMNLRPEKKAKENLVEVIYATLDGNIYFYDMDDGSYTRDPINVGMSFKGAGSLDPRGYPLFYVGSGDNRNGPAKMYIVSLIDGKVIYEQSGKDKDIKRGWYAFDSAPLISAETDTLIWPGENGLLYTIKLNTSYDKAAGTISVNPENTVKTRYSTNTGHKIGCESSAIVVGSYLYYADNGGMFFCVDLNTMELKWAQNTYDDVNATPVFEWGADGKGYIYTGSSMEYAKGTTYLHKLDAATGEIIWEYKYTGVTYNEKVSGGVLSSPIIGKKGTDLEGLVIFSVARTPTPGGGTLVALDTETGDVVWENKLKNYCWSSPVAIYTAEGKSYFVQSDSIGKTFLFEGKTGKELTSISLGSNVEASPAIFENTIVVGTRGQRIYAVTIG